VEIFLTNHFRFQIISLDNCQIHYHVIDHPAPSKVLVICTDPPNPIEALIESGILDRLSRDNQARVVCFEPPGFGFSYPKSGLRFDLKSCAVTIISFLERIIEPGQSVVLIFPCVLGLAAIKVASLRPSLVSHLVLPQVASYGEEKKWAWRMDIKRTISTPIIGQIFLASLRDKISRNWFRAATRSKQKAEELTRISLESHARGGCFCLASALQGMFYQRGNDELPDKISTPALVLWGVADRTHRPTNRKGLLENLDSEKVIWEEFSEIGHFPDLEQPDIFCDRVRDFLSGKMQPSS
jgi:pimeloyl-ACP methyl ester carboxylesterase